MKILTVTKFVANDSSPMMQEKIYRTSPPLFVVGCGRSGTTMLRLMLDSHPEIGIPNESHFISSFWGIRRRYMNQGKLNAVKMTKDIMKTRHFRLWKMNEEMVIQQIKAIESPDFADVIDAIFLAYAQSHGRTRWGDKTPKYVLFIPLLARLFPTAHFVHLIRDGRNVALSYLTLPWGPKNIWEAAWKWRRDVSAGRDSGRILGPDRYLEIRYELLVEKPEQVLKELCRFSGMQYSEKMLQYHQDGSERLQWPDGMKFHATSTKPPASSPRDWQTQMSNEQQMRFEAVAGDLLEELGYERRFSDLPIAKLAEAKIRSHVFHLQAATKSAKRKMSRRFTNEPIV